MAQKAPGKSYRKGISLVEITNMFPNDEAAENWITEQRWPDGPYCPHCGSLNVQSGIKHSSMTHRCRDCPKRPIVLPEDRHCHAPHPARLPGVGHRHLPAGNQPQGRVEHEAAS